VIITANVVPGWVILSTLKVEAICSSEKSVLTTATLLDITEDGILYSNKRENLKYYIALSSWAL
jgi:hypothetical protein